MTSRKTVVLGVTGSIAAYKACDIASALRKRNVNVRVILSEAGAKIITPLALESVSNNPVITDMFNRETPWEIEHISLAKQADVFIVAPATANFMAKAAYGIADDMLSTTLLATRAPVLIAPAMNTNMYENPVVMQNMHILAERGCRFIEPDTGTLACGDVGKGKLASVDAIVEATMNALYQKRDLEGKHIVVSAGPTREKIDPVRYITNRSSGKMGYAIAEAASERGARVTLISGPTALAAPGALECIAVESSRDMLEAVLAEFDECDALIMAAAPADFTLANVAEQKLKKQGNNTLQLELSATQDILQAASHKKKKQVVMGFAAETQNIADNAKAKLQKKKLDFIAANDVSQNDVGFAVDTNAVTLYSSDGRAEESGKLPKTVLAHWLLDRLFK